MLIMKTAMVVGRKTRGKCVKGKKEKTRRNLGAFYSLNECSTISKEIYTDITYITYFCCFLLLGIELLTAGVETEFIS